MSTQDFILDHKIQDQKIGTATKDSPPLDYYCQIIQPQQQNLCDFVVNPMFFFEKFLNTFGFKKKEKINGACRQTFEIHLFNSKSIVCNLKIFHFYYETFFFKLNYFSIIRALCLVKILHTKHTLISLW